MCHYLEDCNKRLWKVVEVASLYFLVRKVEFTAEHLHAEQSEDDDKEEEEEQERRDGAHRVQQRHHQVTERRPVPNTHTHILYVKGTRLFNAHYHFDFTVSGSRLNITR